MHSQYHYHCYHHRHDCKTAHQHKYHEFIDVCNMNEINNIWIGYDTDRAIMIAIKMLISVEIQIWMNLMVLL